MNLDQFMLWRFRNIEGVLAGIKSWNLDTCVFNNGKTIKYDVKNDVLTIEDTTNLYTMPITLKITECTKKKLINEYGFQERFENRHNLSFGNGGIDGNN
jgi:hypothetical protein